MQSQQHNETKYTPPILFIHLNEYGQLKVKNRLVLTAAEVADVLTLSHQKIRWMILRGELPSIHFGSRRVVSIDALEHYIRECEIEEQQERVSFLERYYGYFGFGKPHPEIQRAQERLNTMQHLQDSPPKEMEKTPVAIQAALYHVTVTESGRLECTPRWLLSIPEVAQLLGISRSMVWKLSKQGDFPIFHIERRTFIRVESLIKWIQAKEQPENEQLTAMQTEQQNKKSVKKAAKKTAPILKEN